MGHITVLVTEAVSALNLKSDSVVVDCTLGAGGHAQRILCELGENGHYIGIDADPTAVAACEQLAHESVAKVTLVNENFRTIDTTITSLNVGEVDAVLADLGWRSEQFTDASGLPRGFSFQSDEPLHMTYGHPTSYPFTAHDIVNEWAEEDIANVIYGYGQERYARRIARQIVATRAASPIMTARQLAELVKQSVPAPYARTRIHPATKTFQALRIAVNDEFDALAELIHNGFSVLRPGGRMAIITFHSLEDRIVKQLFRELARDQAGVLVHKKPIVPTDEELSENPRARSAKLRTIEKC